MSRHPKKPQDHMSYAPRTMRAERAAAYLDMSRSKFLELVKAGTFPYPITIDGMRLWDRLSLEAAVNDLLEHDTDDNVSGRPNTFDEALQGE